MTVYEGKELLGLLFAVAMLTIVATTGFAAGMDTLTVGFPGDAKSLDPHKAVDSMSLPLLNILMSLLLR